jgi:cation:H+ antiporter
LIALCWLVGVWLVNRARRGLPWHDSSGTPPGGQEKPRGHSKAVHAEKMSLVRAAAVFALAGGVTLVSGVVLERSGERIASHVGLSGVVFGATVLAAATALPELSTGIASVQLRDYQLAVSDIFGGNAFLPVLFLLANLLSGSAVLPQAPRELAVPYVDCVYETCAAAQHAVRKAACRSAYIYRNFIL